MSTDPNMDKIMNNKKGIIAWCFYDWANSAFPTIVTTFIFATYFTQKVALNSIIGTKQWGNTMALAGLIVAIISPIFGSIADSYGRRKPWLLLMTILTLIPCALLWYAKPSIEYTYWLLACVAIATIGFEIGTVFYNAMLHDIAPRKYLGRVSGWGWGFGYFGGLVCLVIALFVFIQRGVSWFHFAENTAEQVRICGPFIAIWYAVFAMPLFFFTPDRKATGVSLLFSMSNGIRQLLNTLGKLNQYKTIALFLLARMFYIDGLNTIFTFGGIYAVGTFGFSLAEVVQFGIAMNITAGLGAMSFAWLDDLLGSKPTILISLLGMLLTGCGTLIAVTKPQFWVFALLLGIFVGPVQAASRTLMAKMAPPELMTEMFGLYAFSGKATAFLGPLLVAWVTAYFNSQRLGMSMVMLLILLGGVLLRRV